MIYIFAVLAGLILAIFLCIYINPGPKVTHGPEGKWLVQRPIAHRGFHDIEAGVPENSLLAARRAMERGYAIELDVLNTADNQVVVFHDYNLKRMTGVDAKVKDVTWQQIQQLKLLGTDESIPSLAQFLELVAGRVPLLIEVKNEGAVGPLEQAIIDALRGYPGDFAIQSFNPFVMQYFRKHAPEFVRGQLSSNFKGESLAWWKKFLLRNLLLNAISQPEVVAYDFGKLPKWFARRLRKKGYYLLTWTVRSREEYAEAMKTFDNVIFEGFEIDEKAVNL
ncbi:MAG: glycerophosphodiester phosphodiesterase [Firmicutes bacterium]|nr:glycerophosphodiester phosphodiesterase [Bacillota bacterium]